MQIETRELYRDEAGEIWRLGFDRPAGRLHVEHVWPENAAYAPGQPVHTSRTMPLGQCLENGPKPVVDALIALIEPLFPDPTPKPPG